jgi:hypothetical protein
MAGIARSMALPLAWIAVSILVWGVALPSARADEEERKRQAAQLYAEAQNAVMANDYLRAAALFDRANAIVPTPQALRAAIQVYLAADQPLVAIARAEELLRRYPYDRTSRSMALETIDQLSSRFVRVLVTCDSECTVQTDESAQPGEPGRSHVVYLGAGRHGITARFDDGSALTKNIRRNAGQAVSLSFERPVSPAMTTDVASGGGTGGGSGDGDGAITGPAPGDEGAGGGGDQAADMPMDTARVQRATAPAADRFGPPPRLPLLVGGALTAGLGAVAVLSHRDTLALEQAGVDASAAQQRTRLLVGATALSAVSTLAVSIIWARSSRKDDARGRRERATLDVAVDARGYWVAMRGSF